MSNLLEEFNVDENGNLLSSLPDENDNGTSTTERFLTTTANQVVAGFGDEILDFVGAEDAAERVRSNQAALEENNPYLNFTAGALGFLVPGAAIAKSAKLGSTALSAGSRLRRGIGVGAAEGAAISAGNADGQDISERGDEALLGAATGGALGFVGTRLGDFLANRALKKAINDNPQQAENLAQALGTNANTIVRQLANRENLGKMALDAADGNEQVALNRLKDLMQSDSELAKTIARAQQDIIKQTSGDIVDKTKSLSDELNSSTKNDLDDLNPDQRDTNILALRDEIGAEIDSVRTGINVNDLNITRNLINNENSGARIRKSLEKEINEIGELDSSAQITKNGEIVGRFVVLNDAEALAEIGEGAVGGIYAKTKPSPSEVKNIKNAIDKIKKTKKGTDRKNLTEAQQKEIKKAERQLKKLSETKFEPADLDARVFATIAQKFRQASTDLFDNSAEDASKTTSVGALFAKAADDISSELRSISPRADVLDRQFKNVDGQERITSLVSRLSSASEKGNKATLQKRLSEVINGETDGLKNLAPEEITDSIASAIKKQLTSGQIKNFEKGQSAYEAIKSTYKSIGREADFEVLAKDINQSVEFKPIKEAIEKALDSSSDPVLVSKALSKVMDTPSLKQSIDSLGNSEATAYRKAIETSLKELSLLKNVTSDANIKLIEAPDVASSFGGHFAFAATVFNSLFKAIAVSGLRAGRDAKLFDFLSKNKKEKKAFIEFLKRDPKQVANEMSELLDKDIRDGQIVDEDWLQGTLERVFDRRSVIDTLRRDQSDFSGEPQADTIDEAEPKSNEAEPTSENDVFEQSFKESGLSEVSNSINETLNDGSLDLDVFESSFRDSGLVEVK